MFEPVYSSKHVEIKHFGLKICWLEKFGVENTAILIYILVLVNQFKSFWVSSKLSYKRVFTLQCSIMVKQV